MYAPKAAIPMRIIRFINCCKSFEDSEGYLKTNFFSALKTKYAEFLSGPFANMMFEIISEQKNKLKILIGTSTATIEKVAIRTEHDSSNNM